MYESIRPIVLIITADNLFMFAWHYNEHALLMDRITCMQNEPASDRSSSPICVQAGISIMTGNKEPFEACYEIRWFI